MRAGAKPSFQKVTQFALRLQPQISCCGAWLISDEDAQPVAPVILGILGCAECSFVGQVIAQKCSGMRLETGSGGGDFFENGAYIFAFIAARAQFEAGLELEQAKALYLRKRLEKNA